MTPGRQEQRAAEDAAIINASRMKEPLVVIAWTDERAESHLGRFRAKLASRPLTFILGYMICAALLGAGLRGLFH